MKKKRCGAAAWKGGMTMERNKGGIVRTLSPAYAGREGELTAVLQYVYQAIMLSGCGREKEGKIILKIAIEEMRHLEKIGAIIVSLGVPPVFTACPPYPVAYYSASNVDYVRQFPLMLEADIRAEREAIACYDRILRTLRDEEIRGQIEEIRADEVHHLEIFEEMRRDLCAQPPTQDPRA